MHDISLAKQLETDFEQFRYGSLSHGFYDWFCKESSLRSRCWNLIDKFETILGTKKFDLESTYLFFKNNASFRGPTYDDFRICDLATGNVLYTVIPKSSRSGKAEVWGQENDFREPIVEGKWTDVRKFFSA